MNKRIIKDFEKNPLNLTYAFNFLIHSLSEEIEVAGVKNSIRENAIYCPKLCLSITPVIDQLTEQSAMLSFYLYAPQWGKELYECSVGMGIDTKTALGTASASFLFSFMNVIYRMESGDGNIISDRLSTGFAGKTHNWSVYLSDIVGMGNSPKVDSPNFYWDALKDEIVKRLGNQKLCYVKIYASRSCGEVIGECRIDDIKSEELSRTVADMAEKWDVDDNAFASHKMFFFIRQDEDTVSYYPYFGVEGRRVLKEKIRTAAEIFFDADSQEKYDRLPGELKKALGDNTLAEECYSFLPEICAENAFPQIRVSEIIEIIPEGRQKESCYKNQLSDYWEMQRILFELFGEGAFGENTNELYRRYISVSAIGSCVSQMMQKGTECENAKLTALLFEVGSGFEIR